MTSLPDHVHLPVRDIPVPPYLSDAAKALLVPRLTGPETPALDDTEGWRAYISASEAGLLPLLRAINPDRGATCIERALPDAKLFDITPDDALDNDRGVILDFHGGGLILCAGEICKLMSIGVAGRLRRRIWAVDYRMPPDHPYPAALDDAMAAYRMLLAERAPQDIIVHGSSAGGNIAAAMLLRAREEGLPLPAAAILNTPEVDLTESGDSFHTNIGVDPGLGSLMSANLLYADGHDITHPYLSPLFGDFTMGFPPTFLVTGTRDLFLSNTVRMHRALRDAGVRAELHVVDAAGHSCFKGAPEGDLIDAERLRFIKTVFAHA